MNQAHPWENLNRTKLELYIIKGNCQIFELNEICQKRQNARFEARESKTCLCTEKLCGDLGRFRSQLVWN